MDDRTRYALTLNASTSVYAAVPTTGHITNLGGVLITAV
jgi:hypothetical protein